ncbi:MAG: FAD-binding protein [Clostridia bacterium]|nr:FAD-binding protein [Clostridia bacterium]
MEVFKADVLILGGGLSAYMAAYTLLKKRRKEEIMIVAPGRGDEAAHQLKGLAVPRVDKDSAAEFYRDILENGLNQNDPALVKVLSEESIAVFDRARTIAEFDMPEEGSRFRPVTGDKNALWEELSDSVGRHAEIKSGCGCVRLFVQDGRVQGALCYDSVNRAFFAVSAGTVVLATGGYGELYRENADIQSLRSAGSGIGLAYYAGAEMADLEFAAVQDGEVITLGGVVIDSQCRTSLPGLLACGGVTAGVHGAGLMKGNAETAALVFGRKAGHTMIRMDFQPGADEEALYKWANETVYIGQKDQTAAYARIRQEIAHTLNVCAGEMRTQEKIEDGLKIIAHLQHDLNDLDLCPLHQVREKMELDFALIAARLTLLASLEREECCGCYKRAVIHLIEKAPAEEEPVPEEQPAAKEEAETGAPEPVSDETPDAEQSEADSEESVNGDSSESLPEEEPVPSSPEAAEDAAVVCSQPKEPEYEEQIEYIEKEVKPYRVTMKLDNLILMPKKEPWEN